MAQIISVFFFIAALKNNFKQGKPTCIGTAHKVIAEISIFVYKTNYEKGGQPTVICPKCTMTIPEISCYCLHCGVFLKPPEQSAEDDAIDWDNRILCSDGACIGTIEDGKCTVCGKPLSVVET